MNNDLIRYLIAGIEEEIERSNEHQMFAYKNPDKEFWGYKGIMPNKERYKRFRLMLEEYLKDVEKELSTKI